MPQPCLQRMPGYKVIAEIRKWLKEKEEFVCE